MFKNVRFSRITKSTLMEGLLFADVNKASKLCRRYFNTIRGMRANEIENLVNFTHLLGTTFVYAADRISPLMVLHIRTWVR